MTVLILETVFCETATKILQRTAVAQGVNRPPLTAETWVRPQVISREIYGGQSAIELVYFPCTSVFSSQHHSTNTPYSSPARRTNRPSLGTFTKKLTRKALLGSFHVFKRSHLSTVDFSYLLQKTPVTKHRRHLCRSHISCSTWKERCLKYLPRHVHISMSPC